MLEWLKRRKQPQQPLDFAMMMGSCTPAGREAGMSWDHINVADAMQEEAQELARYFIEFHKQILRRSDCVGLLEYAASSANLRALELAREHTRRRKVVCSNLSHSSIREACKTLQLEAIVLNADPQNKYQIPEQEVLRVVREHGNDIAAVVSTFCTTQLGHVEHLAKYKAVQQLREQGAWIHVDAAYGGYLKAIQGLQKNEKVPDADSITIDPYKFIGRQGVALLLVNKEKAPEKEATYFKRSPYTLCTTLSTGPIAAWRQTLADIGGVSGIISHAEEAITITKNVASDLQLRYHIPLVQQPESTIIPVALFSTEEAEHVQNELFKRGFNVGKLYIQGRDYEVHGIRIVITPKVNFDHFQESTSRLCYTLAEILRA